MCFSQALRDYFSECTAPLWGWSIGTVPCVQHGAVFYTLCLFVNSIPRNGSEYTLLLAIGKATECQDICVHISELFA